MTSRPADLDYGRIAKDCVCQTCVRAEGSVGPPDCRYLEFLDGILARLRRLSIAPRIRVFGSATTAKRRVGDIDICIDFDDPMWSGTVGPGHVSLSQLALSADEERDLGAVLSIARHAYGCVDPFFRARGSLWVRDDDARYWCRAKHARRIFAAACEAGVSVETVPPLVARVGMSLAAPGSEVRPPRSARGVG